MSFGNLMSAAVQDGTLSKMDLMVMLNPSFEGLHAPDRAILFDSLLPIFLDYLNRTDRETFVRTAEVKPTLNRLKASSTARLTRYAYHGKGSGEMNGYFTPSDPYSYFSSANGRLTVSSVSAYNLGHFFCDCLDTDEKVRDFVEWLVGHETFLALFKTIVTDLFGGGRTHSK